jgi:twitching motility protein PilT
MRSRVWRAFRANLFRDRHGVGAVFRTIPAKIISAEALGLPSALTDLCNLHKGLVLVTGPTGSGKSTTLCAMIDLINRTRNGHIITIEDPIEFVHENKQCLINNARSATTLALSSARCGLPCVKTPDVVLVGEMRDLRRSRSRSRPLRRGTWSSVRCTPPPPIPLSTASSTSTHLISRNRSG